MILLRSFIAHFGIKFPGQIAEMQGRPALFMEVMTDDMNSEPKYGPGNVR